jgi:hypothetical protein
MHNGICPMCGAAEVYQKDGGLAGDGTLKTANYWKREGLFRPRSHDLAVTAFICGRCGHIALQVAAHDRERLADLFRYGAWSHVPPGTPQDG